MYAPLLSFCIGLTAWLQARVRLHCALLPVLLLCMCACTVPDRLPD